MLAKVSITLYVALGGSSMNTSLPMFDWFIAMDDNSLPSVTCWSEFLV